MLDSSPLAEITRPDPQGIAQTWLGDLLDNGDRVVISAVIDYEIRRELLRAKRLESVANLDMLRKSLGYLDLRQESLDRAAQLWASLRQQGLPTTSYDALDVDVILAAQANLQADRLRPYGVPVIVATANLKHLQRLTTAELWHTIRPTP